MSDVWVVYPRGWGAGPNGWEAHRLVKKTEKSITVMDGRERRIMAQPLAELSSRDEAIRLIERARGFYREAEGGINTALAEARRLSDKRDARIASLLPAKEEK